MKLALLMIALFLFPVAAHAKQVHPTLIGGTVVPQEDYPNVVWGGNCTITVVGERVVAHAAHCRSNGASFTFRKGAESYTARCTHHPEYRGNSTADWMLCKTDKIVEGGKYEVMNTNPDLLKLQQMIRLMGFGCQKWGGPLDGKLRTGFAPIVSLPKNKNYDVHTSGRVALCSGDSGGPSFLDLEDGSRLLLTTNSRSNTTTDSYMPMWALPTAQTFVKKWASDNGVEICGVHVNAKGCRENVMPPPPLEIAFDEKVASGKLSVKPGHEMLKQKIEDGVKQLLQSMAEQE